MTSLTSPPRLGATTAALASSRVLAAFLCAAVARFALLCATLAAAMEEVASAGADRAAGAPLYPRSAAATEPR